MNGQAFENRIDLAIQWGDCDPAGIVFYPNYFRIFNMATDALFGAAGFPPSTAFARFEILGYPMIDTRATFLSPNRFGDEVFVMSRISRWGRSSFDVSHRLHNAGGLSVEGWEKRVWGAIDGDGRLRGVPVPDEVRSVMVAISQD
jgi:4-hydroxybenzoyl-CoA thioesterase